MEGVPVPYLEIARLQEQVRVLTRRIRELEMSLAMVQRLSEGALDGGGVDVEQVAPCDRIERHIRIDRGWN